MKVTILHNANSEDFTCLDIQSPDGKEQELQKLIDSLQIMRVIGCEDEKPGLIATLKSGYEIKVNDTGEAICNEPEVFKDFISNSADYFNTVQLLFKCIDNLSVVGMLGNTDTLHPVYG